MTDQRRTDGYRDNQKPVETPQCPKCAARRSRQLRWLAPIIFAFFGWIIVAATTAIGGCMLDRIADSYWIAEMASAAGFIGGALLFAAVLGISLRRWAKGLSDV